VGLTNPALGYAACVYSLIKPLRIERRWIFTSWCWSDRVGWLLSQGTVWAVIVIVPGVFGQDGGQMSLAEDEHPVGALAADGTLCRAKTRRTVCELVIRGCRP
jgi:hypothetical protein